MNISSSSQAQVLRGHGQFLKSPRETTPQLQDPQIAKRVSSMLLDLEARGMDAVRDYSAQLDRWSPASFRATREELDAAGDALDQGLRDRLESSRRRVREFAELQLRSVSDVEREIAQDWSSATATYPSAESVPTCRRGTGR